MTRSKLEGIDPLVSVWSVLGSLADEHPGSLGKALDDAGSTEPPHCDEGPLAPIAPRRAGSTQPENDELDDGYDEMTVESTPGWPDADMFAYDRAVKRQKPLPVMLTQLRQGTVLYHGTSTTTDFDIPNGPAHFSTSEAVARDYAWNNGSGERPRVLKYIITGRLSKMVDMPGTNDKNYRDAVWWLEKQLGTSFDGVGEQLMPQAWEKLGAAGYNGLYIRWANHGGDDVLIIDPEKWVKKVSSTPVTESIDEDKIQDMNLVLRVDDGDDEVVFNLIDKSTKKRLGFIGVRSDNSADVDGYWQIDWSDLELDAAKPLSGKGLGPVVYQKINDWLKKNKQARLMSDTERSVPAEKMWQKIAAAGKARKKSDPKKSWQGEPFDYYVMETLKSMLFEAAISTRLPGWIDDGSTNELAEDEVPGVYPIDDDEDNILPSETVDEYVARFGDVVDVVTTSDMYHISLLKNFSGQPPKSVVLKARVSPNRILGEEDDTTPRVSFVHVKSVDIAVKLAIKALDVEPSTNVGKKFAVFKPTTPIDAVVPLTTRQKLTMKPGQRRGRDRSRTLKFVVPDAKQTSEVWSLRDVPCTLVKIVQVQDNSNTEIPPTVDVHETSALLEDSRGNMMRLLKAPQTVADQFDEKYGKHAFTMLACAMKYTWADSHNGLVNVSRFWNDESSVNDPAQTLYYDFASTVACRRTEDVLRRKPQLAAQLADMKQTWDETEELVDDAEKTNPKTVLDQVKKRGGLVLPSGWFWLPLTTQECSIEAGEMGHCGEDARGQLWSLRDPQNKAHVTMTYGGDRVGDVGPGGTVHQIKGKQNAAPKRQYWPYIEEFFKQKKVKSFTDSELPETAPELFQKLEDIVHQNTNGRTVGEPSHRELHGFDVGESLQRFEGALSECYLVEQDMPSNVNSYELKFSMGEEQGERTATAKLIDRSGAEAGEIHAYEDDMTGGFKIASAYVRDSRRGLGSTIYRKFNEWLKKRTGKSLTSDLFRSPEAEGLWKKMVSQGLAKKQSKQYSGVHAKSLGTRDFYVMEALHEDVTDDLKLRLKFREKEEDDKKVLNVTIWSDYEETGVGFVRTFFDDESKLVRILSSHLHPGYEKQGIGFWAYQQIDLYVKKHYGYRLASDTERSPAANGLWGKLKSAGKAKHVQNHMSQGYYEFV